MVAKTVNELVEQLTEWLRGLWPDLTGYAHALPEPANDHTVERGPLFVVTASSGTYGVGEASATLTVGIQVSSDAKVPMQDYAYACKWLRDKIDAFSRAVYLPADGLIFGCAPRSPLSWVLPTAQPRPVWQAQITITFDLPGASRENDGFLI
jgi:hypothetical protein